MPRASRTLTPAPRPNSIRCGFPEDPEGGNDIKVTTRWRTTNLRETAAGRIRIVGWQGLTAGRIPDLFPVHLGALLYATKKSYFKPPNHEP